MCSYKFLMLSLVFGFGLSGCASMPCATGCISEHESTYDGAKELSMTPSYVYRSDKGISGSDMRIGLYWSSELPDDDIVLIVLPHKDKPVASGTAINFNMDGSFVNFTSIKKENIVGLRPSTEAAMYFNPKVISQFNVLYYVVSKDFISDITQASDVRLRIDLENTYLEGIFSHNSTAAAKNNFIEYMDRLRRI